MDIIYDVVVVGGGHAGCEAALAAARLGAKTLLLTLNNDHIAQMSCNPCIGGVAKGQVVREIDALGGAMAANADATTIQFRMLNESMGPAAYSPRAQCDKAMYQRRMKLLLELSPNLTVHQCEAVALHLDSRRQVDGVVSAFGDLWRGRAVVICTGTFLNAELHFGLQTIPGGRAGDAPSSALAAFLQDQLGLQLGRLKTGTPVRVLGGTIDFRQLTEQPPDESGRRFAFGEASEYPPLPFFDTARFAKRPCYLTHSTATTAQVVRANLKRSAMYSGLIHGVGARYCPSFEDKIVRFPDRPSHHIFVEPEGDTTDEYYLNGMSTSMPVEVQWEMVRSLPGFQQAFISRYAYAIEYDFVRPHQIDGSLAVRQYPSLFLAGQINGTSGYEEAAGQGLVAGVNAARYAGNLGEPMRLGRHQAYIGVMIDDLCVKEITEPYRLFTSRAEYRLELRQDNADRRLAPVARQFGLLPAAALARVDALERDIVAASRQLAAIRIDGHSALELLSRPDFNYAAANLPPLSPRVLEEVRIDARYAGYIAQQRAQAERLRGVEECRLPPDFNYDIPGISVEARQKLTARRPETLGQAARIDGVTPAEIAILQIHAKRNQLGQRNSKN